jgi:predicted ATP-dependent endonuclease of OLD family
MEGFFAKLVVLVEGPTERLSLPVLLERVGLDVARDGVAVIPVHGKSSLARWRRLFSAYDIPVYVVFDNDAKDDETSTGRRDALRAVGISEEAHDALVGATDWIVAAQYAVFGRDYERSLRDAFPLYASLEEQGRTEGISAKPFLARYVADRLPYDESLGWGKLEEMAANLKG